MTPKQWFAGLEPYRQALIAHITEVLSQKESEYEHIAHPNLHIIPRLQQYVTNGKLLRGILILHLTEQLTGKISQDALKCATAIEFLQSGFLVHDDIIDRDQLRRGKTTIHAMYQQDVNPHPDAEHYGRSLGICFGDVAFFLCYEQISDLESNKANNIRTLFTSISQHTGIAEMNELVPAYTNKIASEDDILNIYTYKTAEYTFCLPLLTASLLAQQDEQIIKDMHTIGWLLGIIFQIVDDGLGLFGTVDTLGKNTYGDIKEGKQTLYYSHLLSACTPKEKEFLLQWYGNKQMKQEHIDEIMKLAEKYDLKSFMQTQIESYKKQLHDCIKKATIPSQTKDSLYSIIEFVMHREH